MSGVSSVGASSPYSAYSTIPAGGKITKAADDAAGLAIQEKTNAQVKGLEVGKENLESAKSLLNVEDGAMEGIHDYLQSIKELSIKSMNGTLTDDDRKTVQDQVKKYMEGINDLANSTQFNEKNVLNKEGSLSITTDASGSSKEISTFNSATEALGIDDYDVTGDFDISKIDEAISKVSGQRATAGAQTNAVDHALTYNSHAALELNGFQMDKEEDNSIKAYQELKTRQAVDSYQAILQKQQQENKAQQTMAMFM